MTRTIDFLINEKENLLKILLHYLILLSQLKVFIKGSIFCPAIIIYVFIGLEFLKYK
jgi:hypothetical protein